MAPRPGASGEALDLSAPPGESAKTSILFATAMLALRSGGVGRNMGAPEDASVDAEEKLSAWAQRIEGLGAVEEGGRVSTTLDRAAGE